MSDYFEGPDYSKEYANKFKDLYLVKYYPNHDRSSIEVYALGDLGRVPETSIWGGITHLRELFEGYKTAIRRSGNSDKPFGYYNNSIWYVATAANVEHALTLFWSTLKRDKENDNRSRDKQIDVLDKIGAEIDELYSYVEFDEDLKTSFNMVRLEEVQKVIDKYKEDE